ncbi:universal stress protein UspC [Yersinia aldovae]|uniref:Universal stress protein UspC n=1 Tax=Yersinia aldovae TaxID=29483 RepID=A0A0T9SYK6_YERAL|nr:hypothetical protein [Yersinia aldovae]CNK41779.1 universal stress protein UspC [Yersinia aldovae]CNK49551.1 universal stress protein UspC [Yersinia aldovae]
MAYNNILLISDFCRGSRVLLDLAISVAIPYHSRISVIIEIYEPELFLLCETHVFEEYKEILFAEARLFYNHMTKDIEYPTSAIYTYSNKFFESIIKIQPDFDLIIFSRCSYNLGKKSDIFINGESMKFGSDVLIAYT